MAHITITLKDDDGTPVSLRLHRIHRRDDEGSVAHSLKQKGIELWRDWTEHKRAKSSQD